MTWFYIDDSFHAHPKAIAAGNAAVGLWTRCGSWVGSHLTDGHVPREVVAMYGTKTEARRLVECGLWERDNERGGYVMHDYLDWNKSRAEVEAKREVRARAGRAGGKRSGKVRASRAEAKREANASPELEQTPSTGEAETNPVPSLPVLPTEVPPVVPQRGTSSLGSDSDPDWLKFWAVYPRKKSKDGARAAWARAVRGTKGRKPTDPADIIAGAERYRDDPTRDPGFTKHPTTWLNQGCWNDEVERPRLRAVGADYEPYRNPNPDDYEKGFFE